MRLKENTPNTAIQVDRMLELLSNPKNINKVDTRRMPILVQAFLDTEIKRSKKQFATIGDGPGIIRLPKGIGRSWNFDVLTLEETPLAQVTSLILLKSGLLSSIPSKIEDTKVRREGCEERKIKQRR